jgi:hypothetical protein
MAASTAA